MAVLAGIISTILFLVLTTVHSKETRVPLVINTWSLPNAAQAAWKELVEEHSSAVEAVVAGCGICQKQQCGNSIGFGGSPDETGETTLDAMIMNGITHQVGAVGDLRRIKDAIGVAKAVMDHTNHTFLVGDQATNFAIQNGFPEESLQTNQSLKMWEDWKRNNCQPNYRINVTPDPSASCGPYKPVDPVMKPDDSSGMMTDPANHDTIGMIVVDSQKNVAAGTTTNGLRHKVPGRIGDSPIAGAGAYASNEFGAATCTGNGDIMMRFLPSHHAVLLLGQGWSPADAATEALRPIIKYFPFFTGAIIVVNLQGEFASACYGYKTFPYAVANPANTTAQVLVTTCITA